MKCQTYRKLALTGLLFFSAGASAEVVIEHSGRVEAATEYHSNIQYLERGAESVHLYRLVPQYQIKALDGVNEWFGQLGIALQRSSNQTVSSRREDPFANIGWQRELENGKLGVTAGYLKESTRTAQLFDTGLVAEDGTTVRRTIAANWTTALTERLDLITQAGYERTTFDEAGVLTGFTAKNINAELAYKLNEKVTPFVQAAATHYRAEDKFKYEDLLVGAQVIVTPRLEVKAAAGMTHFSTSDEDDEAVGFFEAEYTGQKSTTRVTLSRMLFTTGNNAIELGDRLGVDYLYTLSEKNRLGAAVEFGQNKRRGQKNQDALGYFEHDVTASWVMRLTLGLSNIKEENLNSANNNSVGISFTYNSPNF